MCIRDSPKTACELIKMYGSIEEIYKKIDTVANPRVQSLLIAEKEHALLSKQLATLVSDIPELPIDIDSFVFTSYNEDLKAFFHEYNFNSLYNRLDVYKRQS